MKTIQCRTVSEAKLDLYLFGRLPAQVAGQPDDRSIAEIEEHLFICPICMTAAETHELLMTALRSERAQVGTFSLGAGQGVH